MATVSINLPEEQIAAVTAKAAVQGLTFEGWFQKVAARISDQSSRTLPMAGVPASVGVALLPVFG